MKVSDATEISPAVMAKDPVEDAVTAGVVVVTTVAVEEVSGVAGTDSSMEGLSALASFLVCRVCIWAATAIRPFSISLWDLMVGFTFLRTLKAVSQTLWM